MTIENMEAAATPAAAPEVQASVTPAAAEPAAPEAAPAEKLVDGAPAAVTPPAYVPNYKFVAEKQEKEFEEWVRPFIKDKDTEEKFRSLFAKAHGLDAVKARSEEKVKKYETSHSELTQLKTGLKELSEIYKRGDMKSFFEALRVPDEKVFQYVLDRLNYQNAAPEQKRAIDEHHEAQRRAHMLEKQNQELMERYGQTSAQTRAMELDTAISAPEIKSIADSFDTALKKQGAFRDEVIKRGQLAYHTTGVDLPVEQAISEVLSMVKPFIQTGQAQAQPGAAPQANPGPAQPPIVKPPVIPNVGNGKGVSAVAPAFRGIADIENEYQAKFGRK